MYYRLKNDVAIRKWKYIDRAIYIKGSENAVPVSKEEFFAAAKTLSSFSGITKSTARSFRIVSRQ